MLSELESFEMQKSSLGLVTLVIPVLSLLGCTAPSSIPPHDACQNKIAVISGACRVSPLQLFVQPDLFSGKNIDVVLYYPAKGSTFLYANKEAADVADLSSAAMVEKKVGIAGRFSMPGYYQVEGFFETSSPVAFGEGVTVPEVIGGKFSSIKSVRRITSKDEMTEQCAATGCEVIYADGAFLMRVLPNK